MTHIKSACNWLVFQLLRLGLLMYSFNLVWGQTANSTYFFNYLELEDGLPSDNPDCIVQDLEGFMWIGTDKGLARFDGQRFRVFMHNPDDSTTISMHSIGHMLVNPDSTIWLATSGGGLNLYDPKTENFRSYQHHPNDSTSILSNYVHSLWRDHDGTLWAGTDKGLSILKEFNPYQ